MNRVKELLHGLHPQLADVPIFEKAIADENARTAKKVKALEAELEKLEAERAETLPRLAQEVREAEAELIEAQAVLKAAAERARRAISASLGASAAFDSRAANIRGQIRELTEDGELEKFIARLRREHSELPKAMQSLECVVPDADGNENRVTVTNATSIGRRMVAIVGLMRAAHEMRFKMVPDLRAELERMYVNLPAVEPPDVAPPTLAQKTVAAIKKLDPRQAGLVRRGLAAVEDFVEAR